MNGTRRELAERVGSLAARGVYVGTSSWKYTGWCGLLYNPSRYEYRGKFAAARFKRDCLSEYAEVFKTVCVDAAFYTIPNQKALESMANQTSPSFLFALKVTDTITIRNFPNVDRFGHRAGQANEDFLNADCSSRRSYNLARQSGPASAY